ncbi:MAG: Ig-like domain-containing protein, partial [Janthinobacterium lividum]
TLRLRTTPGPPAGSAVTSDGHLLTVAGRGTFAVAGDGTLRFYPRAGTSGTLPPVRYDVADANGTRALPRVTVRVTR